MIDTVNRDIGDWTITISDNGAAGRNQPNPNKYNFQKNDRECKIINCSNNFRINRSSGLCDEHVNHNNDLYPELTNPEGEQIHAPAHKDIIDALIVWSLTRNFGLLPFFSNLSFNTLGNIPDVTTLDGKVILENVQIPDLAESIDTLLQVVDGFFPVNNNSSYQPLLTSKGLIPAIVLAYTFVGLLICEEANRGDRWFCRMVMNIEIKTSQLGEAMPIAYFATRIFPWGVEMNKSARNLTH